MDRQVSKQLRALVACGFLYCASAYSAAGRSMSGGVEPKATSPVVQSTSPIGRVSTAAKSMPEAGFIVLLGSVLVALSAKARRGGQST